MTADSLKQAVLAHSGTFVCSRIHHPKETKTVAFKHEITPPGDIQGVPDIGRLREFYASIGSITFYVDAKSGDAARYLAPLDAWPELADDFNRWCQIVDAAEREEYFPDWVESCLVIGEEPRTGNYILMPTTGPETGAVYHFEHDGFEFDRHAGDIIEYSQKLLDMTDRSLAYIATHMRFVDDDSGRQWWIETLEDNRGNVARTNV